MENIKFETIKKIAEVKFKYRNLGNISRLESNSPPSVFIGSKLKYPVVNVGILSPLERDDNSWIYDDAKYWAKENFEISDIVKLRDNLLNSRFQSRVSDVRLNKKFVQIAQEIAIACKPVDIEIELKNKLIFGRDKDRIITPIGMKASMKKARITKNIKVDRKVDKIINDDVKASEGIKYLYKNNFNEYVLSKILSVGVLGLKKNRRLVPTRWSITATDDLLGKDLLEKIKEYPLIEDYSLFTGEFMGNQYMLLFFPGVWSFELFELYFPGSSWNSSEEIKASTDFENYPGRKEYAFNTAGGYYATKLAVLEYLNSIKKQASVLVIRLETPTYWANLGVWVVRESVRKSLENRKIKFNSFDELIDGARKIGKIKFNFESEQILKQSRLLKIIKNQKNLREWF